jgi:hypothetical protein
MTIALRMFFGKVTDMRMKNLVKGSGGGGATLHVCRRMLLSVCNYVKIARRRYFCPRLEPCTCEKRES